MLPVHSLTSHMMRVQFQTQPGGFGLPIPADYAAALHPSASSEVERTLAHGHLTVSRPLLLAELLADITPANQHDEADFGPAQGWEVG